MVKVKNNSKNINKNDIFICTHDSIDNRHTYIEDAIKNKPNAIIVDQNININTKIPIIKVSNTNDTFFQILNNYYNYPLNNLKIIGVTGTDGKTTTASIIKQLLNNFSNTAYLGTNGFEMYNKTFNTSNTTPSLDKIFYYANYALKNNIVNLVMETSSEGLLHNRCYNITFDYAILTNITKDHLNIHNNFNNYFLSKMKLFEQVNPNGKCILNIDDKNYFKVKKHCKSKIITYGKKKRANYYFYNIILESNKTIFYLKVKHKKYKIISPLLGEFNIYNLVAAIALLNDYGISINKIIEKINCLNPIKGRLESLNFKQNYSIIIDYAHTSYATLQVLLFFNKIKQGKIITVVGCAGNRYKEKRKEIGKIVTNYSDKVIFTMDDPRNEQVSNIIKDMTSNVIFNNYEVIEDRTKAINYALSIAKENDCVLILGKGRDNYMAIKNEYLKYNDYDVIKQYFNNKNDSIY